MHPNEPGLEETEELGADASVASSLEPMTDSEASNSTESTQPTDAPEASAGDLPVTKSAADDAPEASADDLPVTKSAADAPEVSTENAVASEPALEASAADASVNEPAAEAAPPSEAAAESSGLKRGDLIEGTILSTSPTLVTVDVGDGKEGIIPGHELERMNRRTLEELKPGEKIDAYVVNPHDHNGNIVLSVNRALEEIDWKNAETYRQSQEAYESRIAGYNKGGLIVRFGRLRGFVPQSQMSMERRRALTGDTPEDRWGSMVNEVITIKVMEVDRARNRLILSERFASRQTREKRKENLIKDLTVGEVREGRVVSLEDFGAFIDIGGAEGLVHLTEMSWQHVTHPREVLQVGQQVRVEVISIDPDNKRIGLSMKRQAPDPWDTIAIDYAIGQLVQAMVTKLTKFGAFAQLVDVPEIEGLIHISELSDKRVTHPREVVNEGDKLTLRVVKIDIENRRLGLSLKKVNSAEYLDLDWATSFGSSAEVIVKPESTEEAEGPTETTAGTETESTLVYKPESTEEAEGPTETEAAEATPERTEEAEEPTEADAAEATPESSEEK